MQKGLHNEMGSIRESSYMCVCMCIKEKETVAGGEGGRFC